MTLNEDEVANHNIFEQVYITRENTNQLQEDLKK